MKILITAGPTREPIDAVRFISNRSSGRLGCEIALAAAQAGHEVTLLLGWGASIALDPAKNSRLHVHRFGSSAELKQLLDAHWPDHDTLVMAAAVADYRPHCVTEGKPPRSSQPLTLRLEPTPDLVAMMAQRKRPNQTIIAFALEEPAHLETRALEKLRRKGVDAIVANPLGTMENNDITPTWLTAQTPPQPLPRMSKQHFASWLVEKIISLQSTLPD